MFSNLKSKKRITQLLIAVLVVALAATGCVFLLGDFVQEAKAAPYTVNNVTEWSNAVTSGGTVDITLGQDITVTGRLTAIPSGTTVNLNMNGKKIQWYNASSGNTGIMSTSYPLSEAYWGIITNNGTLNIQGTGIIASYQVGWNTKNGDAHDNYGMKTATIVNNGNLTIGSNVTVKAFGGQANTDGNSYQDMVIYALGIYNTGTVNSSGTIHAGTVAQGVSAGSGGHNSYISAYSYGIFGGSVNVTGGNIYSEAKSGMHENVTIPMQANKVGNYAIGVYSNNAVIYGNANITTKATSWRDNDSNYNTWKNGDNMSWGVGVMYSGTNYPYIGADVNINASYQLITDGSFSFPEYNGETALFGYSRKSDNGPGTYGRKAYAVAGINNGINAAMYGAQTTETFEFDGKIYGAGTGGNPASALYRSELAAYNGLTETVSSTNNISATGSNDGGVNTSYITMGAPGSNAGGQYMVYYRYRNSNGVITSASATPNEAINSKMVFTPTNGVFTADGTALTRSGSSGDVKNPNFYTLLGTYYVAKTDGQYGTGVDCSNISASGVTTRGTSFSNTFNMSAKNSYYIWADYQAKAPTNVKVVAENSGTAISYLTTNTSFTTEYTGKVIVPGTDFNLGVIDMKDDFDIPSDNTMDNTDVTSNYAISGTDTSKVQLTYEYSADGTTYKTGLPKDVGKYTIKVTVPSDTDINRAGAGNRNGGTFYITCTITKANPTITGATTASGTYGSTIAELIDTSKYSIAGKGGETPTGTWTYSGFASTDYPEAGTRSLALIWTPTGTSATNYNSAQTTVTITVAKRDVTVAPADSTVTYGAKTPSYVLNYSNLAACDESKKSTWLADSTFEVNYNGTWQAYASTMLPGTYDMRIASFSGDTTNNNFTTSGTAKLTINKAPLYYTATATNKTYDGNNNVNVSLVYSSGAVNGDSYTATISTTGTVANSNAGESKAVTVNTADLNYTSSDKYYISIQNSPTVTVSKATPTATAEQYSFTYDADRTLSKVALNGESSVTGTWSWKDSSIVPTVDVTAYTAIFTPTDTTNYNTIEVPVAINVSKAEVTVSVENKTVSYGDASPALPLVYTGFTGADNELNVATTGTISAASDYSMGKNVGTYPITITMTDYEAVNYSFVAATDCKITVEKKNITITAPSGSVTYGDADLEFTVDDLIVADDALYGTDTLATLNEQAQFGITTAYEKGDTVGSYDVTVSAQDTTNYTFTFVNGTLTVTKAVLTVTAKDATTTYNGVKPQTFGFDVTGYKIDADEESALLTGAPVLSTQYVKGSDAGQYAISITIGTLAHPNYTFKLVGGTLTVNKLTLVPTVDDFVVATIVHDEAYSEAVFENFALQDVAGTYALKDSTAIADYTTADKEDASLGKYTLVTGIFTPTDSDNYNTVELTVYLVIKPHAITGAPVITGTAMDGSTITASVAGMTPSAADSYTYQWYIDGKAQTGENSSAYTVKNDDIGKSIYVVVDAIEDKGYTGTAQSASVTAVEAFSQLVSADQLDITGANATYTYDGTSHPATVAVKSAYANLVSDNITVYYNGTTEAPYDAGTYIVTIDVGAPTVPNGANRNDYYGPVSGLEIGTITIEKKEVTATFTVADKTYDGTRKVNDYNVTVNGVLEDDYVVLDASAISIVFNKASAGEQKIDISGVKLAGDDVANYKLVIADTTAIIEKATLNAVASGVTRIYNGSAQVNVTFTNITGYASIDSASTVYVVSATATATSANAGTWLISQIEPELGGTSAGNYVLNITNSGSAQVTITKATPTVTAPSVTGLVYNANRTLGNIDLEDYYTPDSNGYWQFDDTSVVPTVKKTSYAATYVSKNSNYSNYSTNITVIVTPKTVTLTAVDTTVSYGKAASYSVKADGFTGNDSLATMGGTQPTYVCTYTMGSDVGTYTIKVNHNLDSNGNYEFDTVNGTLTVVPADLYVTATATNRDYNGSTGVEVKFAIASGKYSNDDVNLSTTTANGTASSANAGTRTVVYTAPTLTGSKASNYNLVLTPASGILTVTINKLNPEGVVFPKTATIEFSQALSWAKFSDEAKGDGTFALVGNIPNALGNYAYEVVFTPSDSVNYNTVTNYVTLTVTTCEVNYEVGISGTAQVGERLTAVFTGLPSKAYDYVQYQWYRVDDTMKVAISGATSSTYTATENDEGYTIVCVTYFNSDAPFVFDTDIEVAEIGSHKGICGETSGTIKEENLTFWQRLMKWIQSIIEALTGIMWTMGM